MQLCTILSDTKKNARAGGVSVHSEGCQFWWMSRVLVS